MKNQKGIYKATVIIFTVLALVVIGAIIYSVNLSNQREAAQEFVAKMITIQDAVDKLCSEYTVSEINGMGLEYVSAPSTAQEILNNVIAEGQAGNLNDWYDYVDNDTTNYRYFDTNLISEVMGISEFDTAIWLNPVSKNVVAVEGVTYSKVEYHRQYDLSMGQTLDEPHINVNFNLSYELKTYNNQAEIILLKENTETAFAEVRYYKYDTSTATYEDSMLLTDASRISITQSGTYKIEAVDYEGNTQSETDIEITIVNAPILAEGMTAIDADGNELTTSEEFEGWYNYASNVQNWANAKLADGSEYVWIPRFAYNINSEEETIDIIFISGTSEDGTDGEELPSTYRVAPAFQDGSKTGYSNGEWDSELTGFWIAKYPTSAQEINSTTMPYNVNEKNKIIKSLTAGRAFTACRSMEHENFIEEYFLDEVTAASGALTYGEFETDENNIDTHLTKNSEWGAVAYLSFSKYGNASNEEGTKISSTAYSDETISTNINNTGVYGMTNSISEIVAAGVTITGVYNSEEVSTKYATVYQLENNSIVGDGIADLAQWSSLKNCSYPNENSSIFYRGGNSSYIDIFKYGRLSSTSTGTYTFRPVIVVE